MVEISVLIPYKNSEKYLRECLESVQKQTFVDWEIIGIDDGSDDSSQSIFSDFAKQDSRIKTFSNSSTGIIPALQQAFELSSGEFITRIDSDDIIPERRFELMLDRALKTPTQTIVTGLVRYFSKVKVSEGYRSYEKWLNDINLKGTQWKNIYRECVIASPNWLTNWKNISDVGGFESLTYPEDYDLVLKWYREKMKIETIPEVTLHWREHPGRTSRTSENYNQEAFFKLKIAAFLENDFRSKNLIVWGRNPKTKLVSQILKAAQIPFENFELKDFRLLESYADPQLLVAVYPSSSEREKIICYLRQQKMEEGVDWWWL